MLDPYLDITLQPSLSLQSYTYEYSVMSENERRWSVDIMKETATSVRVKHDAHFLKNVNLLLNLRFEFKIRLMSIQRNNDNLK